VEPELLLQTRLKDRRESTLKGYVKDVSKVKRSQHLHTAL
jgi:hypothetical protein